MIRLRNPAHKIVIRLDIILGIVQRTHTEVTHMTLELDNLTAKVTALETAVDTLIGLAKQLAIDVAAAKEDPAAIQALSDSVQGELDKVAAAIAADTPPVVPPAV